MQIDRRVTNGLAWAGVLLVVGIPTADFLSAQFLGDPTLEPTAQIAVVERIAPVPAPLSQRPATPVAKPEAQVAAATPAAKPVVVAPPAKPAVRAAAVTPTKPVVAAPAAANPAAGTADAVNAWLDSGKPLPSYITDESAAQPTQVAATPPARPPIAPAPTTAPAAIDPVQVASIQQPKVAPMPMPLSMRPSPVAVVRPAANAVPVAVVGPNNDLIVATPGSGPRPPADITAQELEDWESGPLAEFLAERQGSRADVTYDEDGFFLDEGPNRQQRRPVRVIGPVDDFFFPFFE